MASGALSLWWRFPCLADFLCSFQLRLGLTRALSSRESARACPFDRFNHLKMMAFGVVYEHVLESRCAFLRALSHLTFLTTGGRLGLWTRPLSAKSACERSLASGDRREHSASVAKRRRMCTVLHVSMTRIRGRGSVICFVQCTCCY